MVIAALLLLQAAASDDTALIAHYRTATRAEVPCERPVGEDIVVCGLRAADRYRVPFVSTDPRDAVPLVRERLLESHAPSCGRVGPFFNDCGYVGFTASTSGSGVSLKTRKLAP